MRFGKLKPNIGEWQAGIELRKRYDVRHPMAYTVRAFWLKFNSLPDPGAMFGKEHYTGLFWWANTPWPRYVVMRSFRAFGRMWAIPTRFW